MRIKILLLSTIAAAANWCGSAYGHAFILQPEAPAGGYQLIELGIPHGCLSSPTTSVRIKIPDGITLVRPEGKTGWKLTYTSRKLATPLEMPDGTRLTEVADEVVWSGGKLADLEFERFNLLVKLPATPGVALYFKTIQQCEKGEHRWVEVPAPTRALGTLKSPAPHINLVAPKPRT